MARPWRARAGCLRRGHDFDVVLTSMEERMAKRRGVDAGAPGVDAAKEGGEE